MNWFELIKNIFICGFEISMLKDLGKNILMLKDREKKKWVMIRIICIVWLASINSYGNSYVNLVCVPIVYTVFAVYSFHSTFFKKMCIALCYYMMAMASEFIFAILLNVNSRVNYQEILNNDLNQMFLILLMKVMTLIFVKCVCQIYQGNTCKNVENKTFFSLLVLPASTMILFIVVFYADIHITESHKIFLVIGAILLLFANAYMFYLFEKLIVNMERVRNIELLYTKSKVENHHLQQIEKVNENHRILLHDVNKYIRTAVELVTRGEIDESLRIFHKVDKKMKETAYIPYCGHKILNAILCERKDKANELGIRYQVDLSGDLTLDFMNDIDLISIVGNLLDNAMEAAVKLSHEGFVEIRMYMANDGHFMLLEVKNNFLDAPMIGKNGFISRKKNKELHGIGMHTIERIVKSYNGKLEIDVKPNEFMTSIIFQV